MSSFTYFEEWATPKKWAYEWAYISPQPTHLSASLYETRARRGRTSPCSAQVPQHLHAGAVLPVRPPTATLDGAGRTAGADAWKRESEDVCDGEIWRVQLRGSFGSRQIGRVKGTAREGVKRLRLPACTEYHGGRKKAPRERGCREQARPRGAGPAVALQRAGREAQHPGTPASEKVRCQSLERGTSRSTAQPHCDARSSHDRKFRAVKW